VEHEAQDLLEIFLDEPDPNLIALRVMGQSMVPTLLEGDLVVMAPESAWHTGDIVVAEIPGLPEEYSIKRLGRVTRRQVTLISDNFLEYQPVTYIKPEVSIRGRVIRVVRTPDSRQEPRYLVDANLLELYRNPQIQRILEAVIGLREPDQRAVEEIIQALVRADEEKDEG